MAFQKKSDKVKFLAKCSNQALCMIPNRVQIVEGIPIPQPGKHIRFNNGEYDTEDKKEIEFIRNHALFNVSITELEVKEAPAE